MKSALKKPKKKLYVSIRLSETECEQRTGKEKKTKMEKEIKT